MQAGSQCGLRRRERLLTAPEVRKEFFDIGFECGDIRPTARVLVTTDSRHLLVKKDYKIVSNNLISADHAAIILNGYDYVTEHLK